MPDHYDETITLPIKFERRFQLWYYTVSFRVLLLRSNKDANTPTRVDVMFRGVTEMRLPSQLRNLTIGVLTESDPRLAALGIQRTPEHHVFSLEADDFQGGYAVAWNMYFAEDEKMYDDESLLDTGQAIPEGAALRVGQYL